MNPTGVHKFGGSSLADASRIEKAIECALHSNESPQIVVVSAVGGVTDTLIEILGLASKQDEAAKSRLQEVKKKHFEIIENLEIPKPDDLKSVIESDARDLEDIVRTVWLSRSYTEQTLELFSGYGELWSARIFSAALEGKGIDSDWLDARKVLIVDEGETGPKIQWEKSKSNWNSKFGKKFPDSLVITGYIASTSENVPTTLKRNGSDYSASIFANLSGAPLLTIWTDVTGVLSADPTRVPEAVLLKEMSYQEAMELAYFGASVIHPHTMSPAIEKDIPIQIRSTFEISHKGTLIHSQNRDSTVVVKGFSTIDQIALINVEGSGMIGVPGVANRLFGALRGECISVILISQASSEHSICFAVPGEQKDEATEVVRKTFKDELEHRQIQTVELIYPCSILAAVGDNMVEAPGVAARFFGALGKAGVNIRAVAQGSSERNISVVIDEEHSARALRSVHAGFYLSDQTLSVGLVGPGLIGKALLDQLKAQKAHLKDKFQIDLRVRAIANSKKMLLKDPEVDLENWKSDFDQKSIPLSIDELTRHIRADHIPHSAILDCTASDTLAESYPKWLDSGVHIVTPNKKANSSTAEFYNRLKTLETQKQSYYLYETTVGAGLPVIRTLRDLVQTGDEIIGIEGIFSGTLSYIFNNLDQGGAFSDVVRVAKDKGYTEPDPRDDLSGMDVARKVLILMREAGMKAEIGELKIESLIPKGLESLDDVNQFLDQLKNHDEEMEKRKLKANEKKERLRYVGVIESEKKVHIGLKSYPETHPFCRIQGSENIILFRTKRYDEYPLVVQGPGAGPEVTAAGVFSDLLRLAGHLGAPL